MAKLLAFSFFPANLPPRSGGEARLFALYEALSHHHDVTLLTSGELGDRVLTLRHNSRFSEVRVPKTNEFVETWAKLSPLAGSGDLSGPCLAAASAVPSLLHEAYLANHAQADVIIHDSPFTVGYDLFLGFDGKPRIYNSYNVEFDLYGQIHGDAKTDAIAQDVRKWEAQLVHHSDLIAGCTDRDIQRFSELYGPLGATAVVPNGVAPFGPASSERQGNQLVFIGSGHRPNQTAAALIRDVLSPGLPDFEFHLIGACMDQGQPRSNVISHGIVDEAEKQRLLRRALASVNPMLEGGGSSLKIPDLVAHGVPLISTELGARGFSLKARNHYSPIDLEDLVSSVRSALDNPDQLQREARAATDHIRSRYVWPKIAENLASEVDKLVADRAAQPRPLRLVAINDYDPFESVGGGCTRIRGLYEGASEQLRPLLLTFSESETIVRRELFDGRGLAIAIPKTAAHREADNAQAKEFHVSTADFVAMSMAPSNPLLMAVFDATAAFTELVACEHPYMATMLLGGGRKFIYSSQNFELGLKRQLLAHHPRRDQLLADLTLIEKFSVGCSELVVAVSDDDAAAFAAEHDLVAPVVVVSNGSEEPSLPDQPVPMLPGFNACFLGSGHMPNHMAARFVVDELAPLLPDVTFHIAGSVSNGFDAAPANVRLLGRLNDEDKTRLLLECQMALNPMAEGSGSNVKIADYLTHGLPVLSTPFGARGYEGLDGQDLQTVPLDEFVAALTRMKSQKYGVTKRNARRKRFNQRFSMKAFGAEYGSLVQRVQERRSRALFVTYRYNEPALGGGELYANRLVKFLADSGVAVDVVTTKVNRIEDQDRFGSAYPAQEGPYLVPTGHPLIRVAKFSAAPVPSRATLLQAVWAQQSQFEMELYQRLERPLQTNALTWGWVPSDANGRWTLDRFGLSLSEPGRLSIKGQSPGKRLLIVKDADGSLLFEEAVDGYFEIACDAPRGSLQATVFDICGNRPADPRPLGLFITELRLGTDSMLADPAWDPTTNESSPLRIFNAMHDAAKSTRFATGVSLTDVRGPYSPLMEKYLARHVGDYDLVITHNAVFRTAAEAVAAAKRAGVPSVIIPHAHFEDDFYHFPDVIAAIANASLALVTPPAAVRFLSDNGLTNTAFMSPGIDSKEVFSAADEAAFASLYRRNEPFILIVGRKAAAKGYQQIIAAAADLRSSNWPDLRVVMIGPDDDAQPVSEEFVDYFGVVDRSVLRGAYRASRALATMSTSESFGIVILEAGLAARPVVANANCAAFAELVVDGTNGYLAQPNDLSDRLATILADHQHATELGKNGREMALQYDWSRIGAAFVKYCNALIAKKGG